MTVENLKALESKKMKNVLFVTSSPRGQGSYSEQIARRVVDDLKIANPSARIVVRNVARNPLPHVGEAFVSGIVLPPEQRNVAQAAAIAVSDALIDEVIAADVLVLAAPMYNFGPPSALKAWIDHVVRAGRTFAYTAQGPQGLLKNKKAVLVVSRGGIYSEGPMKAFDFQESYLKSVLGFIGIADVEVVRVEGVALGEEAVRKAMIAAKAQSDTLTREFA
ncbi:MAG: FMN-dependent NADH-azoreductase [Rhodospirillales bacterium]